MEPLNHRNKSPPPKYLSKVFMAPTFTSPANKINLVEINSGVFK